MDEPTKQRGDKMKTWMKYLVIGWSIVCLGLIIATFQIMKNEYVEVSYSIEPSKATQNWALNRIRTDSNNQDIYNFLIKRYKEIFIDKRIIETTELNNILKDEAFFKVESHYIIDNMIFVLYPIYAFLIWGTPVLVFSLIGVIFTRK